MACRIAAWVKVPPLGDSPLMAEIKLLLPEGPWKFPPKCAVTFGPNETSAIRVVVLPSGNKVLTNWMAALLAAAILPSEFMLPERSITRTMSEVTMLSRARISRLRSQVFNMPGTGVAFLSSWTSPGSISAGKLKRP